MTAPKQSARKSSSGSPATGTPEAKVDAARRLCERVFSGLAQWVGVDGSRALFVRARAQARDEHPLLENIEMAGRPASSLNGVEEAMQSHGEAATVAALEAVITALVSLLGRLIGEDMALKLISRATSGVERNTNHSARGDKTR